MKESEIIHCYKTVFKKLTKHYERSLEDFDADDIHHFRVEMKKLRAFIRLVNLAQPDHQHKIPGSIKKIYHLVGNIRNLQLQQQRIANLTRELMLEMPRSYLQSLHNDEKLFQKVARQTAGEVSLGDFEKKLVNQAPYELNNEIINVYLQKNKTRLAGLLMLPVYYDEALHDVRKVLKDLMYNYEYLENALSAYMPDALNDFKTVETFTVALGDFYDLCIALFLLSPVYVSQIVAPGETEVLNKLRAYLRLRKYTISNQIVLMLTPAKQQLQKEKSLLSTYELL